VINIPFACKAKRQPPPVDNAVYTLLATEMREGR
jgi:hypothetical protein